MLKTYYQLAKPGIVYGNLLPAAAAFLLAATRAGHLDLLRLAAMLVGLAGVIASACVTNNILDRRLDARMDRTRRRALVTGRVSWPNAAAYAAALGLIGAGILVAIAGVLTAAIAAAGWLAYVVVYGLAKRGTKYSTIIGSVSGAAPPVVGYVAVTGRLDAAALILFLILAIWQMPHFYAIAIFRSDDYAAANLPVLPVLRGATVTRRHIIAFIIMFMVTTTALATAGYAGYSYLVATLAVGIFWLYTAISRFDPVNPNPWARRVFGYSLITLMVTCLAISLGSVLP